MTAFTVSTYRDTQFSLGAGDWLTVARFGTIRSFNDFSGGVIGTGANAIQVDGFITNLSANGGTTSGILLTGGNDTVVVAASGYVRGWAAGIRIEGGGNTISCAGAIESLNGDGIIVSNGSTNTVTIESTGSVRGANSGVYFYLSGGVTFKNFGTVISTDLHGLMFGESGNSITNAGTIFAERTGIWIGSAAGGANSIVNSGVIRGYGGILSAGSNDGIYNTGTIEAIDNNAISAINSGNVINTGFLISRPSVAVVMGGGADAIVNNGMIHGRTGAANLGHGKDLYDGRNGVQVGLVNGEGGDDTIYGGAQSDMLAGGADSDTLYGMGGIDALAGGDGVDTLYGGDGADNLMGEAGADLIYGGAGGDVIRGGLGGDLIVFNAGDNGDLIQNLNEGGNRDGFDLRGYFNATGYTGTTPRAAGIMAVLQNGADTDVYLHGAFAFRIQGVVAAAIDDSYFLFQ